MHLFLHQLTHNMTFIELQVQYMKTTSSEHVVYINCSECQNINKKQFVSIICSELVFFLHWTGNLMNNLLSYCGLNDAKINNSDKNLPVLNEIRVCCKETGKWQMQLRAVSLNKKCY